MWVVYLMSVGPDRLSVIRAVRELLGISSAEAKGIIDSTRPAIVRGDEHVAAQARNALRAAGASVSVELDASAVDVAGWIDAEMSADGRTCRTCGEQLFVVAPATAEEEIRAFSRRAGIQEVGGMHFGVYCPNRCVWAFVELGDPDRIA